MFQKTNLVCKKIHSSNRDLKNTNIFSLQTHTNKQIEASNKQEHSTLCRLTEASLPYKPKKKIKISQEKFGCTQFITGAYN